MQGYGGVVEVAAMVDMNDDTEKACKILNWNNFVLIIARCTCSVDGCWRTR